MWIWHNWCIMMCDGIYLSHEFDRCRSTGLCEDSLLVHDVFLFLQLHLISWQVRGIALHIMRGDLPVHPQNSILHILCTCLITAL